MPSTPSREASRVSSRIKGKYTYGEFLGNIETVLETCASHDEVERDEDKVHYSSPYGLRRIFSNPISRHVSAETSLLASRRGEQRQMFSDAPHVESGVPLTKTKSCHYPSRYHVRGSRMLPFSLTRRVSHLRYQQQDDEDTMSESVDTFQLSKRGVKRKWVLLVSVLGMVGVGCFAGFITLQKKNQYAASSFNQTPTRTPTNDALSMSIISAPPPSGQPTPPPTQDTTITFYVMADTPYTDYERNTAMPNVLAALPEDAELLFHLGDLESRKTDNCEEWAYVAASQALLKTRVPVFVLPGDNDMNDCDDHDQAEGFWTTYFQYIDTNWNHNLDVTRWGSLDESFSFLRNRVLFFGINIVGGTPYSYSEKTERHSKILQMLKSIMNDRQSEYDVVVLLGHAEPKDKHSDLFEGSDGLANFVQDMKKPFLHIHGDWHSWYEDDRSFGVDNYLRISLDSLLREDGEIAYPIRVEIDSSKTSGAIKISRGRADWVVNCCSGNGWPKPRSDDDESI